MPPRSLYSTWTVELDFSCANKIRDMERSDDSAAFAESETDSRLSSVFPSVLLNGGFGTAAAADSTEEPRAEARQLMRVLALRHV